METAKTVFEKIPETITVPRYFVHKKGEVIIIADTDVRGPEKKMLRDFYGILPDFPERASQGEYEMRDII